MEPSQSLEVEITFDVDPGTTVPDWTQVPLVAGVADPEVRELDAVYFDTADYVLGRAGYALRRREGGHDAGWHLKGPREGSGRMETGWPLDIGGAASVPGVPAAIAAHIAELTTAPLVVIARIRNTRTAYVLRDAGGGVLAEMVDDRVHTRDEQRGIEQAWREWEIELGASAPEDAEARSAFFAAVTDAAYAAGAREASSESKLARALGV
ncbi:CYTH domain-containing protein [Microbacterium schleiferi]|uniref:CYTH domain-containing protein n=1 Tax=Microbacterium schleiferi TaxID=69362 RepID=A0A7S8MYF0_9MICO|nr:CYTH domain-containing protein [Microbacterium schleiferi]QPE05569.1 CYTH domain-containing protein [Microbacterium schleiferi]